MTKRYPVISITGSSGAGTTAVKKAFEHIFYRLGLKPLMIEGDSFHRYDRVQMREKIKQATLEKSHFSHFSIEANCLEDLRNTFKQYGETNGTRQRYYVHNEEEGRALGGYASGTFTP